MSQTSLTSGWRRQNSLRGVSSLLRAQVLENISPDNERCVKDDASDHDGEDQSRDQPQNGVGVREGHNGQTDVFRE